MRKRQDTASPKSECRRKGLTLIEMKVVFNDWQKTIIAAAETISWNPILIQPKSVFF